VTGLRGGFGCGSERAIRHPRLGLRDKDSDHTSINDVDARPQSGPAIRDSDAPRRANRVG
jgi:hypothetical protein